MGKAVKDPRVKFIRANLLQGEIKTWEDIFYGAAFPPTVLATHLGTNCYRMRRLIHHPGKISLEDIKRIADYFDVPFELMNKIISGQYLGRELVWSQKKRRRRNGQ